VDNRSMTLERPDIKFVGRAAFSEAHAQSGRSSQLRRLAPTSPLREDFGMPPAPVAACEMSEPEQASLPDAAHRIAVARTARTCRERGRVLI
jgi:hypothetical protein